MYNPRWPHTFYALVEYLDENGIPVTDENGDPCAPVQEGSEESSELPHKTIQVVEYDGRWNPRTDASGAFQYTEEQVIPWGYRTATGGIKESGEVIVADYKISCPMLLTELPTGTTLIMTDYTHTFRVKVIKQTTYNWGTNLWVDNIKN